LGKKKEGRIAKAYSLHQEGLKIKEIAEDETERMGCKSIH
jgi:hypothetical protein